MVRSNNTSVPSANAMPSICKVLLLADSHGVPLFLAPNFSHDSEVAAIMAAKAENINGLFVVHGIKLDIEFSGVGRNFPTLDTLQA